MQGQLSGHKNKAIELQKSGLLSSKATVCAVNDIFRRREESLGYLPSPPHPTLNKAPLAWATEERKSEGMTETFMCHQGPFLLPHEHTARLHFPISTVVECSCETEFWPKACGWG